MKALMILGAIVGFAIGTGCGLALGNPWPSTLWKACAAALISAVLTRWWSEVLLRGLRESLENQQAAAATAPSTPAPKSPAKV